VGVGVVLAAVVRVLAVGFLGGEPFEPFLEVGVQPDSSSLMKTPAEMCIAFTKHI